MPSPAAARADIPEVRDLRFQLDDVPKHWHGGRRSVTLFFDNLSVFFPPGERFFVASVKAFRSAATDPTLREQVDAFCAQEGHHSREHVRYNKLLASQGYPAEDMEARVEKRLRRVTRLVPPRRRLAVTCALEHFTSLMATLILEDLRPLEGAHPQMAALWRWHAAEENEHKAVAFDLYRAAGGPWIERCYTMLMTTVVFWLMTGVQQVRLMKADGILFSAREWWALFRFLFLDPGGMQRLLVPYLRYYRRSFHPWEIDSAPLVERWKTEHYGT